MITVHPVSFHLKSLRLPFLWWHRQVNGFELIDVDRPSHTFMFRCTHYDSETRHCDSYDSRPGMCRDFPRLQLYSAAPGFLPECGYRAVAGDAELIRECLRGLHLPPDKLAAVEKQLHVFDPDQGEHPTFDGTGRGRHADRPLQVRSSDHPGLPS